MRQNRCKKFLKIGYLALYLYLIFTAVILIDQKFFVYHFAITLGALVIISILSVIVSISARRKLLISSSIIFTLLFLVEFIIRLIDKGYDEILINRTIDTIYHSIFAIAVVLFGMGMLNFIVLLQKRRSIHELAFENSRAVHIEFDKGLKKYVFEFSKSFIKAHEIKDQTRTFSFEELLFYTKDNDKKKLTDIFKSHKMGYLNEVNIKLPGIPRYLSFMLYSTEHKGSFLWIAFDISAMQAMRKRLELTKGQLKKLSVASKHVVENTNELIVTIDVSGKIIQASNRFCEIFDYDYKNIQGIYMQEIDNDYHNESNEWIEEVLKEKITYSVNEYQKNNETFVISWKNIVLDDGLGQAKSIMSIGEDITKITHLTRSLEYQANYNQITELLNENGLNQKIEDIKNIRSAACFTIDINEYYSYADYYGINISKNLLKIIANELSQLVSVEDVIANKKNNQFIIILINPSSVIIEKTKEELEKLIIKTYVVGQAHIQVKKSIGYALYKDDTDDLNDLINYSGLAAFHKVDTEYNQVTRYHKFMKENLEKNIILTNRLLIALNEKKLDIHMQHIVDAKTNKPLYVEALARWKDDDLGFIPPDEFFNVARKSSLLEMLEIHLVQKSFSIYYELKKTKGYEDTKLSINLTPEMFLKEGFAEQLSHYARMSFVETKDVFVEVSENTFVHNTALCTQMIKKFKDLGFFIAIDDFGSQYSSLAVLENFEYDMIKIDGSFINFLESKKNLAIVEMISRIGSLSQKIIVAEMVETKEVSDILIKIGVNIQQGYYFHKPQKLI